MDSQAAGSDSPQRPGQSLLKRLKLPETPDYVAELAAIPREHRRVMPDNDPRRQSRFGLRRMFARDPTKHDRAATPLELFFDLVFAAAVGIAASTLFDLEETGHFGQATAAFLMVFFSIWLAWDSYTWFASAFDTDDWLYRLCTFVQMAGALVLAAGVKPAMEDFDFAVTTIGYVIMRLALVFQWLRAAVASPWFRPVALKQAVGITIVQVLWVARWAFIEHGTP
ncbi:MAG: low temperature requirement protein A, partial [Propionibacteriaceae bacterium]|nr:low temperature requirement protein A [Propionibacteriaceae bacterium]